MSTLVAQTISNGTVSTSSQNVIQGSAKAWVNFNGGGSGTTAGAIRGSYNVSSITVNATGSYTLNFTNAFADTNYSAVFGSLGNTATAPFVVAERHDTPVRTTTQLAIYALFNSGGWPAGNPTIISVAINR